MFYHDGRQLVQIWKQEVDGYTVTRTIEYDLFRGQTGYLKGLDFESNPDEEAFLIKDEQGTVRRMVKVTYSGGSYSIDIGDVPLDAYGDWFDPGQIPAIGIHYMRYISCRVEGYADPGVENQALLHTDHRHYYAPLGVFLQREPLLVKPRQSNSGYGFEQLTSLLPYRYALNKPILNSDPSGLGCNKEAAEAAAIKWGKCCKKCEDVWTFNDTRIAECEAKAKKEYLDAMAYTILGLLGCLALAAAIFFLCSAACTIFTGGFLTPICLAYCLKYFIAAAIACGIKALYDQTKIANKYRNCFLTLIKWREMNDIQRSNCLAKCQRDFCDEMISAKCADRCESDPYGGGDEWIGNPIYTGSSGSGEILGGGRCSGESIPIPASDVLSVACCFYPPPIRYPGNPGDTTSSCGCDLHWAIDKNDNGYPEGSPPFGELPDWAPKN